MKKHGRKKTQKKDLLSGNALAYISLFFAILSLIIFVTIVGLFYKIYSFSGLLAVPQEAIILANTLAVLAIAVSIYAIVRGSKRKIALSAMSLSFLVLVLPYILELF